MTAKRASFVQAIAALLMLTPATPPAQTTAEPTRHVLLIGASRYPSLREQHQLFGPDNDVRLVRQVLESKFGIPPARIHALAGWPSDPAARPTRSNIERAFKNLAATVARGDQVMVFFAGHGSQQPDTDPPGSDENDGLDEIFLPADAAGWDGTTRRVRNAITDDEIREWVTAIRNRGAFVWLVFDACQSSTLTRGSVERARRVPVEELVPREAMAAVRERTRGTAAEPALIGLSREAGGIAALYAAQTTETTPERRLPDGGPFHGLFTYTLMEAVQQSPGPMTYRELALRVIERYRGMDRSGPLPGFEGGGLDEMVFGGGSWPGDPALVLGPAGPEGLLLRAGALHGVGPGTVLAVFDARTPTVTDTPIGHVRVVKADATSSIVQSVAFGDQPAAPIDRLIPGSRCRIVVFDLGDQVLRVAVDPEVRIPSVLQQAFDRLGESSNGLAAPAASLDEADWVIRRMDDRLVLAPAAGWRLDAADPEYARASETRFVLGPADGGDAAAAALGETLWRISRARNLMHLSQSPAMNDADVQVDVELIRYRNGNVRRGSVVTDAEPLRPGDHVEFRISNSGRQAVDVTLLHIDAHYKITAVFPVADSEADNRLGPGAVRTTIKFEVTADSLGREQVVAIGVVAQGARVDFRALEQPSLAAANDTRRGSTRGAGPSTPLQRLLDRSLFGVGQTRGLTRSEARVCAIRMLTWRTERAPSPVP
jgi:hypothetical protein